MAKIDKYVFSFKEVATSLIKEQGIHEGIWGLFFELGINAVNIGNSPDDIKPAAIVPIQAIGLQRFPEVTALSVDAGEVNPPSN